MAGLSQQHQEELNKVGVQAQRYDELRKQYAGDSKALQQIDVYDSSTEYHVKVRAYIRALMSGNTVKEQELKAWINEHYPDI